MFPLRVVLFLAVIIAELCGKVNIVVGIRMVLHTTAILNTALTGRIAGRVVIISLRGRLDVKIAILRASFGPVVATTASATGASATVSTAAATTAPSAATAAVTLTIELLLENFDRLGEGSQKSKCVRRWCWCG